jgi:hypothetical protein
VRRNWPQELEAQTRQRPQARRLLTHPGVGPVTALATEVFLGDRLLSFPLMSPETRASPLPEVFGGAHMLKEFAPLEDVNETASVCPALAATMYFTPS